VLAGVYGLWGTKLSSIMELWSLKTVSL
jgi:hypothetical protein